MASEPDQKSSVDSGASGTEEAAYEDQTYEPEQVLPLQEALAYDEVESEADAVSRFSSSSDEESAAISTFCACNIVVDLSNIALSCNLPSRSCSALIKALFLDLTTYIHAHQLELETLMERKGY